jgi:hypothetical protein
MKKVQMIGSGNLGRHYIDITNTKFNKLTAIEYLGNGKWLCTCNCGNTTVTTYSQLHNGHTKSCGCLKIEVLKNRGTNILRYDLNGEFGIGYINDKIFYFDKEDYDVIKDYSWSIDEKRGYVYAYIKLGNKKTTITMHRLVMKINKEKIHIDHKNHATFDNRKENLRISDNQRNQRNRRKSKNNKSGTKGVCFSKRLNKWRAYIYINTKYIELGYFDKIEDAIEIRKKTEVKYFKEDNYNIEQDVLMEVN